MKFTNNATTSLAASLTNVATSLTVSTGQGALFPVLGAGEYFWCTLTNVGGIVEIIKVTARATDTFTIVRAQDNTSALAWNTGDRVELRIVAAVLDSMPQSQQIQEQSLIAFTTAGTSTAYTLTPTPAITAYITGQCFDITFNATCGAAPTLAISGVATPPNLVRELADGTYANIGAGEITANHTSRVRLISATQALVERLPRMSKNGTWTPSVGGTATYGSQIGKYVDHGDTVTLYWDLLITTLGTGSSTTISGAPFANAETTLRTAGNLSYFASLVSGVTVLTPVIQGGTNVITLNGNAAGAGSSTENLVLIGNGTRLQGNITYRK